MSYEEIKVLSAQAVGELLAVARTEPGEIFVVGCSSSEIGGFRIGKGSNAEIAEAVYEGVMPALRERGLFLAAQCCEHLNRALIVEKAALLPGAEICNVVPQLHAGGGPSTTTRSPAAISSGKPTQNRSGRLGKQGMCRTLSTGSVAQRIHFCL